LPVTFRLQSGVPTVKKVVSRDPERTRKRILNAALHEFSIRGFAGARVDTIARRAGTNKRMLYHYFEDKDGLFCAVLRYKIKDRMSSVSAQSPDDEYLGSSPSVWFKQNCHDIDWVRLLAWESLQTKGNKVLDEKERQRLTNEARQRIEKKQRDGRLRRDVRADHLQLAKVSLSMFPFAFPQITRLIIGCPPSHPKFQRAYAQFLETISAGFRPSK
jgi:AcrR family transcriptional regulator